MKITLAVAGTFSLILFGRVCYLAGTLEGQERVAKQTESSLRYAIRQQQTTARELATAREELRHEQKKVDVVIANLQSRLSSDRLRALEEQARLPAAGAAGASTGDVHSAAEGINCRLSRPGVVEKAREAMEVQAAYRMCRAYVESLQHAQSSAKVPL